MEDNSSLIDFKNKYGFLKHPKEEIFINWAKNHTFSLLELFPTINKSEVYTLDLSVNSSFVRGKEAFNNLSFFEEKLKKLQAKYPEKIIAGGYLEKRALYTSSIYLRKINTIFERRNTHLGIDFWLPKNTPIHALLEGEVVCATIDNELKGYGGLIILKHNLEDLSFYTLYGHLSKKSISEINVGDFIKKGMQIAFLGDAFENGSWVPHLHFQIMLTLLDYKNDFPGVVFESEIVAWKSCCPNPNFLFKRKDL